MQVCESDRERERKGERERERERKGEGERERERGREGKRQAKSPRRARMFCLILLIQPALVRAQMERERDR